jgi:hypothetical protein
VNTNNAGGLLGGGGGIYNDGTLTIRYSTISDNLSTVVGGGLLNGFEDVARIAGSTFSGNASAEGRRPTWAIHLLE